MAEGNNIGIQKIKQYIEALKDVKSNEKSLLTLVISPSEELYHVRERLEKWLLDIQSEEGLKFYMHAKETIGYAQQKLLEYDKVPDNGLIIYTGIVYTDDGKKDVAIGFEPFKLIHRPFNWISDKFDIKALTILLEPEYQVRERSEYIGSYERDKFCDSNIFPSTQSIRRGKEEAKPVVNPQSFAYFSFLFAVGGIITFQLGAVRLLLRQNPSLFKDHGGVFMIMIIVSGFMAVLSSFVLVLSSFLLKHWMKKIHYTILKTIGSFSAILVPFSLGAAVFVPSGDLNWISYTFLFAIFGGLLYLYSFIWKVACAYQQGERYNSYPVHWAYLLIILVPLSISLLSFFSPNLRSLATVYVSFSIIVPLVIFFMRFNREDVIAFLRFNRKDKGD